MTDRAVNLGCVVAWSLWAVTGLLLLMAWLVWDEHWAEQIGWTALAFSAAAATAMVRCYFVNQNRMMRRAFELGQEARIHPLR